MRVKWQLQGMSGGRKFSRKGEADWDLQSPLHIKEELPEGTIVSLKAETDLPCDSATRIFLNGYQTWTYCPEYTPNSRIRGLHRLPRAIVDRFALNRYGDYHFVDYPFQRGILHGMSWGYLRDRENFRLFASLDEDPGYTLFTYDANRKKLLIERDCSGVSCGGNYDLFDLYYDEGSSDEVFDRWFKKMKITPITDKRIAGYSSWYNRYQNIDEKAIRTDLKGCKDIFLEGDLFQIDDGWEPFVGDWLQTDPKKFPNGLKPLADEIHQAGFKAGLWLAPFVAEEKSALYQQHPDWFFKVNDRPWKCGSNWSGFYALDIDHKGVRKYLQDVFTKVFDEWGFDLVKLDFLYGAAPYGTEKETRAGRMHRACKWLRRLCGDHMILGCGVPVMPSFGLFEYSRISCDVSLDWNDKPHMRIIHRERVSTLHAVGNIYYRQQLNGRAFLSDPDVFFLRSENCQLTAARKEDLATLDALLGGVWLTSDDPGKYTSAMKKQYRELRKLTEAKDIRLSYADGLKVHYTLDGEEKEFDFRGL